MHLLYRIVGGSILIGIGLLFVMKTEWFMQNIGRIEWAEAKLGDSRLFYKLLGIVIIFFGLMAITGLLGGFVMGSVGRLFVRPT
jgi:hypothetical protein